MHFSPIKIHPYCLIGLPLLVKRAERPLRHLAKLITEGPQIFRVQGRLFR